MKRKPKPARKAEIISSLPAVPTRDLARLLNVSSKTIAAWASAGIVVRAGYGKYDLALSIQGFAKYMREIVEKRGDGAATVASERAGLLSVQRRRAELELAKARGDLQSRTELTAEVRAHNKVVRNEMLRIKSVLLNSSVERTVAELVDEKIREALTNLADHKTIEDREGSVEVDDMETAT